MTSSTGRNPRAIRLSACLWLVAIALLAAALSGCGSTHGSDGRALFATNCALCHGPAGQGTDQGPSLRVVRYLPEQLSDAEMAAGIRNGVPEQEFDYGPMPAFPRLDDDEIDAIVEVVRDLQREGGLLDP